jgi:hypothetical protein
MCGNRSQGWVNTTVPDSDADADPEWDSPESEAVAATEAYETETGVVLYDSENPLAWIQADNACVVQKMA